MKLRIYRTFSWQCNLPTSQIRFGGDNPLTLVAHDELQACYHFGPGEDTWVPVEVVEMEKPEHPRDKKRREDLESATQGIRDIFKNAKAKEPTNDH